MTLAERLIVAAIGGLALAALLAGLTVGPPAEQTVVLPASTLRLDSAAAPADIVMEAAIARAEKTAEMAENTGGVAPNAPGSTKAAQAPPPTIRDLLDARWAAQPGQGEGPAWAAFAEAVAAEYRRDTLIPTRESKVSPAFTPEQLVQRYADRDTFDAVLLATGWLPEDLDQAWAVARCEAPSEYTGIGPDGGVDGLAVGPGDELGWFQIGPWYYDAATAVAHDFPLLFGDFDLLNPLENALAAAYLRYETPQGWGHWSCVTLGLADPDHPG